MKNCFLTLVLFLPSLLYSQIQLRSAGGESGIVVPYGNGFNLGYEFSKSETAFSYSRSLDSPKEKDKNRTTNEDTLRIKYTGQNYKLKIPIKDNEATIFKDEFNPGVSLGVEAIWSHDALKNNAFYKFIRVNFDIKKNTFGNLNEVDNTIILDEKISKTYELAVGGNWLFSGVSNTDHSILALSLPLRYKVNPIDGLKTKEVIVNTTTANNGVIQKPQSAFIGEPEDFISLSPRVDFAFSPGLIKNSEGKEIGPRYGLLASTSVDFNFKESETRFNFSIGPSLHAKHRTDRLLATLQFEFTDITGSKNDPEDEFGFDDVFSIKLFVGYPIGWTK